MDHKRCANVEWKKGEGEGDGKCIKKKINHNGFRERNRILSFTLDLTRNKGNIFFFSFFFIARIKNRWMDGWMEENWNEHNYYL